MKNLKNAIVNNRKETKALSILAFESKEQYATYRNTIEKLRLTLSDFVAKNRDGLTDKKVEEMKNQIFPLYKNVLAMFEDIGGKVKCQASDFNSLIAISTVDRKAYKGDKKETLPVSTNVFRKNLENFIADRVTETKAKTAFEIEQERKARNQAKKEQKKAEKAKAKAEAEKNATKKTVKTVKKAA